MAHPPNSQVRPAVGPAAVPGARPSLFPPGTCPGSACACGRRTRLPVPLVLLWRRSTLSGSLFGGGWVLGRLQTALLLDGHSFCGLYTVCIVPLLSNLPVPPSVHETRRLLLLIPSGHLGDKIEQSGLWGREWQWREIEKSFPG